MLGLFSQTPEIRFVQAMLPGAALAKVHKKSPGRLPGPDAFFYKDSFIFS
jgi:hypothetical protein